MTVEPGPDHPAPQPPPRRPAAPAPPFAPPQPAPARRRVTTRLLPVELATYVVVIATAAGLVLYFALRR